jgi:hypothetical protein
MQKMSPLNMADQFLQKFKEAFPEKYRPLQDIQLPTLAHAEFLEALQGFLGQPAIANKASEPLKGLVSKSLECLGTLASVMREEGGVQQCWRETLASLKAIQDYLNR